MTVDPPLVDHGQLVHTTTVPPGLAPEDVDFVAIGFNRNGDLVISNEDTLKFR